MEPKKKLKLIPIWQFFTGMTRGNKLLFALLFLSLLATVVVTVAGAHDPSRWSVDLVEVTDSQPEEIALRTYAHGYREMTTEMTAWKEQVTYVAGRIEPRPWMVIAFVLAQVLGWAYLLSAASYVRHLGSYAVFFAFAILVFVANFSNADSSLSFWLVNGGLALLILVPSYLLQQEILKLAYGLRLLIYTVVTALPFALQYHQGGWIQLHGVTVGMFPVLAIVATVFMVFVASDLSNLVFYLATNAKNPKYRVKFPIIFTVILVLSVIEFVMLQKEMGWDLLAEGNDISLRPIHLLALASLVTVGTKQALSPVVKDWLPNTQLSMGLAALPLIAMSFVGYLTVTGEYMLLHTVERISVSLFFAGGIAHCFYMLYNFGPLIRAKVNFYFLSMMPRKLLYFVVIVVAVAGAGFLEASTQGRSKRLLKETVYNLLGDQAMLEGKPKEALLHYRTSVDEARGSVKGNYNLAMLQIALNTNLAEAREHLRHASDFTPFPYAYLNLANLENSSYSPILAKAALEEACTRMEDPHLRSNLALTLAAIDQPDSAILQLKAALNLNPDDGALYANMSRIYLDYARPEDAKKFVEAGLALPELHRALVTNAYFLNMRYGSGIQIPEEALQRPGIKENWVTTFNAALERYKAGDLEAASRLLAHGNTGNPFTDSTAAGAMRPDSLLLDGMILFDKGLVEQAISRMDYIDVNYPEYRRYTNHFLGVGFFNAGSPEMAATYFRKSVEHGRTDDLLSEARMEFDRGNFEYAYNQLVVARDRDSTLSMLVAKEETKMQLASGEFFFASLGFDLANLTDDDWMQVGMAAGKRGNMTAALEAFRKVLFNDAWNIAPYREMARISLDNGDSLAMDNLKPALDIAPDDLSLNVLKARILLAQGDRAGAQKLCRELAAKAPQDRDLRIVTALVSAANGDTTSAIRVLDSLRKLSPIDPEVVLPLSRIYRGKRMDFEGQNMILAANAINPANPDFWYELAHFERLLVRPEESGASALQAMQRAISLERAKQIAEEFKEEIASFRAAHPDEGMEEMDNGN